MIRSNVEIANVDAGGVIWYGSHPDDGEPASGQVVLCVAWIRKFCKPTKTFRPKAFSYSLKHAVERWAGEYVSNGAFIVAALAEGYKAHNGWDDAMNATFNLTVDRKLLVGKR